MCLLILSTNFVLNVSHSKKTWVRYNHKSLYVFMLNTPYAYQIVFRLELSRQISKNIQASNFIFKKISIQW